MSSSTRSSLRVRAERERGYALLSTLVIAVLFFALIALVLWESTLRYRAAQSFRSRIVAQTLAENAVEIVAKGILDGSSQLVDAEVDEGTMTGRGETSTDSEGVVHFKIDAEASTRGVSKASAAVTVQGRIEPSGFRVRRTRHSQ